MFLLLTVNLIIFPSCESIHWITTRQFTHFDSSKDPTTGCRQIWIGAGAVDDKVLATSSDLGILYSASLFIYTPMLNLQGLSYAYSCSILPKR